MKPTEEQMQDLIEQLEKDLQPVYLRCDGYLIHTSLTPIGDNCRRIAVHIHGHHDGDLTHLELDRKQLGEVECKFCAQRKTHDGKILVTNLWNSGRALINHIASRCRRIQILNPISHATAVQEATDAAD